MRRLARGSDRVIREFPARCPNRLCINDFSDPSTWRRFVYMAIIMDAFASQIVGRRVSRIAHTGYVFDALEQALYKRRPAPREGLVRQSDRGSRYIAVKYTELSAEAGIAPSVDSVSDRYNNTFAETINSLSKAELIHRRSLWKSFEAGEMLSWVGWFDNRRLIELPLQL